MAKKPSVAQDLYEAVKQVLQDHGFEHGYAQVARFPNGDFTIVAGAGDVIESGGFGGGGASGTW